MMPTYEQAMLTARDGTPFSNHTMWEIWADQWCYRCTKDSEELVDQGKGCPLIMVALMRKTPAQWTTATEKDEVYGNYHCSEFEERRDYYDDPTPDPPPPPVVECDGQLDLVDAYLPQALFELTADMVQPSRKVPA